MAELSERDKIILTLEEAGDTFEIAKEEYERGEISTIKKQYPLMKKQIEKGMEQLRMLVS